MFNFYNWYMVNNNNTFRLSCVRVLGFLARSGMERAKIVLKEAGAPFFLNALNTKVGTLSFLFTQSLCYKKVYIDLKIRTKDTQIR